MTVICDECKEKIILPDVSVVQGNSNWHYHCYQVMLEKFRR
jgi:hypothetical protein